MRFEVPQFIEIEDKIIGPFSWRQFLYLGGGIGMGAVLFLTTPFLVFVLFGIPLGGLAFALAYYPINNRPFSYFLEALFQYFYRHRLYLWRRKDSVVYKADPQNGADAETFMPSPDARGPQGRRTSINSLARRLEMQALQKKDL